MIEPDLQSFEVHELLDLSQRSQKSNFVPQDMKRGSMVLQYLRETDFLQYLRNNYSLFKDFSGEDLRDLLKIGEIFRVKKCGSIVINFNQPTVCVVVFGDVRVGDRRFRKGDFFVSPEERLEVYFQLKTTMVMLHKEELEMGIHKLQNYYFRKRQITSIFPNDLLQLTKIQLDQLVAQAESYEGVITHKPINGPNLDGIFILYEGNYSLKMTSGITFTQLCCDYFGEETLWQSEHQYELSALNSPYRFLFISKQTLVDVLTVQNISILQQIYIKKLQVRNSMIKNISENLEFTKKFLKTMEVQRSSDFQQHMGVITRRPRVKQIFMKQQLSSGRPCKKLSSSCSKQREDHSVHSASTGTRFRSTLYKDQKAQSKRLFRKRSVTVETSKSKIELEQKKSVKVRTEPSQLNNLPSTLSLLMNYYEGMKRSKKEEKNSDCKLFLGCPKERRLITNMKINKQLFLREYLGAKNHEDRAFKTWR